MSLPTLTGIGRATADPELRFAGNGTAVCTVNLAFNSRRKNPSTQEWEDGDVFFVRATAFKELAESMAESLTRGTEVVVTGRLKTEQWEDRATGEKRSGVSLLLDGIGPNLRYATAKVSKAERSGTDSRPAAADDPWGSAPPAPARQGASGFDSEPPF
jgi:single-strand DNA-binding protein